MRCSPKVVSFKEHLLKIKKAKKIDTFLYQHFRSTGHSWSPSKKGKRKVQGVPQSQTAALPRPQEEEETDKSKQAQTEQTYEKH